MGGCAKTKMAEAETDTAAYSKIDKLLCEIASEENPARAKQLQEGVRTLSSSLGPVGGRVRGGGFLPAAVVAVVAVAVTVYNQWQIAQLQAIVDEQKSQLDSQKWGSVIPGSGGPAMAMCWPWEWPWQLHLGATVCLLLGWLVLRTVLSRGGIQHGTPVPGKWCPQIDGDFMILMIGVVPHSLWSFWRWMPILRGMVNMGKELQTKTDSGFLGYEVYVGLHPMIVQYWRSFDHLKKCPAPEWATLTQAASGDPLLGVWHETYIVRAGDYEASYSNMPPYGLGKVGKCHGKLVEAKGQYEKAESRLGMNQSR